MTDDRANPTSPASAPPRLQPYTVEQDTGGCDHCGVGGSWTVVGPNDVAIGQSFGYLGDAEDLAEYMNIAWHAALAAQLPEPHPLDELAAETEGLRLYPWQSAPPQPGDARLRSPTATGEDREAAHKLFTDYGALIETAHGQQVRIVGVNTVANAIAAARAQGVREERERWLDCAQVDATMEGPKLRGWNRSALDRFWRTALAAPEPQEEDKP